ncbi:MAG: hypothetical protein C0625_08080 [Arcobacter sp.]|nr:MAG: hypothetical protein C0625_08080 [Arcobacter sp.]
MSNINGYELVFISTINFYNLYVIFILITLGYFIYKVKEFKMNYFTLLSKYILYFLLVGFFVNFMISIYEIYKVKNAFRNITFLTAKGVIEKFHPMNKLGHEYESFIVDGKLFKISYTGNNHNKKTLFYTMTKNRNGPIKKNGQEVIIHYIKVFNNNKIIKFYVKKKLRIRKFPLTTLRMNLHF